MPVSLFSSRLFLLAEIGRCGVLIEIAQEKPVKGFPPPLSLQVLLAPGSRPGGITPRKTGRLRQEACRFHFLYNRVFCGVPRLDDAMQRRLKEETTKGEN